MPVVASRRGVPALAAAAAIVAATAGCATSNTTNGLASDEVLIQRTAYGVAHITAGDYESLAYGVAYAHAQDNVCQTAEQLVTVSGQRSKFFGADKPGAFGLRMLTNLQADLYIQAHMDDAALARASAQMSADAQASLRGSVAGYNRYLADTGVDKLPAACRGAAWVRPMTPADLYRVTELSMTQAGVAAFADAVIAAVPPATATTSSAPPSTEEAIAALTPYRITDLPEGGGIGSNGWAFGRDTTPDGSGLLLGNPHFPWVGANRFWQLHLTIPGRLDVMGATIGQSALVQIGFNKDVAWTHTVSTGKRFTIHELMLVPGDPTSYLLDGEPRKMTSKTVEVEVPGVDGQPAEKRRHTVWSSVWGPVLVVPRAGLTWTAKTAYSIKDANTLNTRAADTWLAMNRASSVAELRAAMGNQGIPWVNTMAADRAGNAMYADLSVVPDVSADQLRRCAPSKPAAALFATAGIVVLDGSKSSCDWNKDASATAPGLIPASRMPAIVRSDWVQNSNDSYWLSNPGYRFADISPLVGPQATPQRLRTRIGIQEIRNRLAGSDGLPGQKMGMKELQQVLFRDRNLAGHLVMPDLVAACRDGASTDAQRAGCQALGFWNRTSDLNDAGAPLFREFWRKAKDIKNVWRVPFDPADPVATPAGLNLADPTVKAAVFGALGDAVELLRKSGFAPNATLAQTQVKQTNRGPVPVHGGDEFEGVLNKVETQGQPTLNGKGYDINYGSSYIQTVGWDAKGPVAQAILTYGQSSDPASPYAYDQLSLFSHKQWNPLPFQAADVAAQQVGPTLRLKR